MALEIKGKDDLLVAKFNVNVQHDVGSMTALQMYEQWRDELGITGSSSGSFNADDGAWVFTTNKIVNYKGVDFVERFNYASEAGFGLYNSIPTSTSSISTNIPNVNRMRCSTTKPLLFFTYHWTGVDLKSYDTQWSGNSNGYCIFAKHSRYSGSSNIYFVAIKVSVSGIYFYFEKSSNGTIPLYANTSDGSSWINQYLLATIFEGGANNTLVSLVPQSYFLEGSAVFNLGNIDKSGKLAFIKETPAGTDIKIEVSYDGDNWIEKQYGDIVDDGNVYVKATMTTTDENITPILKELWLEEVSAPQNKILITMDWWNRFNNVEDKIKVLYDATKGALAGDGGVVESFEIEFTPEDLIPSPTPGINYHIDVVPEVFVEFLEVTNHNRFYNETDYITTAPSPEVAVGFVYNYVEKNMWLKTDSQLMVFNSSGNLETTTINLIAEHVLCISPQFEFSLIVDDVEYYNYITVGANSNQAYINIPNLYSDFPSLERATVKVKMTDLNLIMYDYITLYKAQNGSNDIITMLTNEYHTIVAIYESGIEKTLRLKEANSFIKIYKGTEDITNEFTINTSDGPGVKSVFGFNKNQLQIYEMTENTGEVIITATHDILPTQNISMQLVKSKRGVIDNP